MTSRSGTYRRSPGLQAAAIREWLRTHRPSPVLRADLNACGFGYLLEERTR